MIRPSWPTAAEYRDAVGDPNALRRHDLRDGRLELGSGGLPKVYAGTFSTTFRFGTAHGDVAFRCFKGGYDDPQRRYAAIAELLRYVRADALCRTEYDAEAIRIDGTPWPAVVMEWVSGRSLDAEIERHVREEGGGDALLALASQFREVARSLVGIGIAHGDLQHGNILVADGKLRLIDYDAMFLPAIADLAQVEFGHRNYQHPQRRNAPFDSRLDRFSSLVIYTTLVALAADRSLWTRFNDGDNLLFRAHDFTSNGQSELFRALLTNNATSGLADILRTACDMPMSQTPSLEDAIAKAATTMSARPFVVPPKPPVRPVRIVETIAPKAARDVAPQVSDAAAPVRVASADIPVRRSVADCNAVPVGASTPPGFARSLGSVVLIMTLVGLAIGVGLAVLHRGAAPQVAQRTMAVRSSPSSQASQTIPTVHPSVAQKQRVAAIPVTAATVRPTAAMRPTATPTAQPTKQPTAQPTMQPTATPTSVAKLASYAATPQLQGAWQIAEANNRVGTIVWSGAGTLIDKRTIVLDAHKASVAGKSATPCERRTILHAAIALGVASQTVPYQETNCEGASSSGEIRVNQFAKDAGSFAGSVWLGGAKLGDFTASKQ